MIVDLGRKGAVAELADALDLGSSSLGSAGSIPVSPTFSKEKPHEIFRVVFYCRVHLSGMESGSTASGCLF